MQMYTDEWKIVFAYGSHVYGTNNDNSDEDYIIVGGYESKEFQDENRNIKIFPLQEFLIFIEMHEPCVFECISLLKCDNEKYVRILDTKFSNILKRMYQDTFNIVKLRKAFSQKASNFFVKAKKKILIADEDSYIGMKSLFHSIRLFDFGIQIAKNKFITDFTSCNTIWNDIMSHKDDFLSIHTEDQYKELIQPWKVLYNSYHSEFKAYTEK